MFLKPKVPAAYRQSLGSKLVISRFSRVLLSCAILAAGAAVPVNAQRATTASLGPVLLAQPADRAARTESIKVDVNLVLVPVTVNDSRNHIVMGLNQQNFTLLEDGREQRIRYFSTDDAPMSVGVLVDVSDSMARCIDEVRDAMADFFFNANPQDDYFVIAFSDRPTLVADTTTSLATIQSKVASIAPGGNTALYDAVFMGLNKLKHARYERKALVIISDGGDNVSRHKWKQMKGIVQESDAQLYAIRIFDSAPFFKPLEERLGNKALSELTEASGGRMLQIDNPSKLSKAAATVSHELRNQYILGYQIGPGSGDGKWHKIKVRASAPDKSPRLQVYSKSGYLAPLE